MGAILVKDQKAAAFVMEDGTFEGVYRITEKVCGDVEQVTGVRPKIIKWQGELQPAQVYVATLGNSEMSEAIAEEEGIELSSLCGTGPSKICKNRRFISLPPRAFCSGATAAATAAPRRR